MFRKYNYDGRERRRLGFSLGLFAATLNKIEDNHRGECSRQLEEILYAWLRQADKVKNPTWYALVQALRSIDENAIADQIHKESEFS